MAEVVGAPLDHQGAELAHRHVEASRVAGGVVVGGRRDSVSQLARSPRVFRLLEDGDRLVTVPGRLRAAGAILVDPVDAPSFSKLDEPEFEVLKIALRFEELVVFDAGRVADDHLAFDLPQIEIAVPAGNPARHRTGGIRSTRTARAGALRVFAALGRLPYS